MFLPRFGLSGHLWTDFFHKNTFFIYLSLQNESHTGRTKKGRPSKTQKTQDSRLGVFMVVNLVIFKAQTFFVLNFKWHFESWPI